ncbi:uncharacterized protein LOC143039764 [Oratosquilla oratoria]|uniref:uncharacterized protein LOC143039764 n=1 Tax=Oratosquilla oratoria TaxID=337810 RepID=UPI003F773037
MGRALYGTSQQKQINRPHYLHDLPNLPTLRELDDKPTRHEVHLAISSLKNKAAGPDGIPAKILKCGGNTIKNCLHNIIHRGISPIATADKVFSRIMLFKILNNVVELLLPENQPSFRKDRNTIGLVSWIRHRDLHLLTVDHYTYTSDQRFQALYEASTGDWVLLVASVQPRDQGTYECQIGTTPPRSHFVHLHIMEPQTLILGGSDSHINTGSTINLTCLVLYHPKPPDSISWYHSGQEISYDSARGGVSVVTERGEATHSSLMVQNAVPKDSGNYTCQPSGSPSATIYVHVLNEHRAAMHSEGVRHSSHFLGAGLPLLLFLVLVLVLDDLPCTRSTPGCVAAPLVVVETPSLSWTSTSLSSLSPSPPPSTIFASSSLTATSSSS